MLYLVEGYNRSDYITHIINWEPLCYFNTMKEALVYIDEMKNKNYNCRVRIAEEPRNPVFGEHWDIIF